MPTSDDDLQKLQSDTQDLRDQVEAAERDLLSKQRALANDTTASQLKAEQADLQARLKELKAQNTTKAVAEGAANAIDPIAAAQNREVGVVRSSTEEPDHTTYSPDSSNTSAVEAGTTPEDAESSPSDDAGTKSKASARKAGN